MAPEPLSLQAGSYYLHPRAGFADGADGVHTEGDILSSEVIAGGVVLCEPDDAHDSVDELDHQNGCKERQVLTKSYRPLSATREGPRNLILASAVWPLSHLTAGVHRAKGAWSLALRSHVPIASQDCDCTGGQGTSTSQLLQDLRVPCKCSAVRPIAGELAILSEPVSSSLFETAISLSQDTEDWNLRNCCFQTT